MLVLPSVGASVTKIVLNESATKAKLFFNDGSSTIIRTQNTPNVKSVVKKTVSPNGSTVIKKKIAVKKSITENSGIRAINKTNRINMESVSPEKMALRAPDVIERAKKRAAMLESQTMDASSIAAMSMSDGQDVSLTT